MHERNHAVVDGAHTLIVHTS